MAVTSWTRATAVAILGLVSAAIAYGARDVVSEVRGPMTSCSQNGGVISLTLADSKTPIVFQATAQDWPSRDYRRIVVNLYRAAGGCPANGTRLRITRCGACAHEPLISIETDGSSQDFDGDNSRLWVIRQYFDTRSGPDEPLAVSIASMVLARYNRRDGQRRSLWIRDTMARALNTYLTKDRAFGMIKRFGRSDLNSGVSALARIATKDGDRLGLMRAFPFIPVDPRASPFVGAWGTFATEVYLEAPNGKLKLAFKAAY
jgi:hypothetical protein